MTPQEPTERELKLARELYILASTMPKYEVERGIAEQLAAARSMALEEAARIADAERQEAAEERKRVPDEEGKACWLWAFDTANVIATRIRALAETPAPAATGGTAASDPAATSDAPPEYRCVNGHDRCEQSYPGPDCLYCEKFFTAPDASRPTNAEIARVVGWLLEQHGEEPRRPSSAGGVMVWRVIRSYLTETLEAHTP